MDDLAGLSWNANTSNQGPKPPINNTPAIGAYPSLRPSPSPFASGRNTPLSTQGSGSSAPKAAAKPAQDSFSNLLNLGSSKSTASLSLKEQQERLEAEKRRKEEERRKNAEAQYGSAGHFLDSLGSGGTSRTSSPAIVPSPMNLGSQNGPTPSNDDDDLFAAFRADTKVDKSSFYPPPSQPSQSSTPASGPALDLGNPAAWNKPSSAPKDDYPDDDPFGLGGLKSRSPAPPAAPAGGAAQEDDFLGDLGRPVEEIRRKQQATKQPEPGKPIEISESESSSDDEPVPQRTADPFDKAVAQLVDYGFTAENARRGLTESGAGVNVQAAVNWLLDDAHRQSNDKAKGKTRQAGSEAREASPAHRRDDPAWTRGEGAGARRGRDDHSPANGDDIAKTAAAMGSTFFKTANTLWKSGQKKMQQAVADFQYEGDPNQPKWMRSAQQDGMRASEKRPDSTEEAMMLDSGMRPDRKPGRQSRPSPQPSASRDRSPAMPPPDRRASSQPRWQQQGQPLDSRSRLNRLAAESEDLPSYVSPNRRRKGTPATVPPEPREASPAEEPDLLFGGSSAPSTQLPHRPSQKSPRPAASVAPTAKRPSPPTPRPTPRPPRQVPSLSPAALQTSTRHRLEGTAHFKRGDYAAAHESYASSLSAIPSSHPLAIILLTNHALTSLKTGEPKKAIEDADQAIALIGPSLGQGETIAVVNESGAEEQRDMKDLYGKALSRKAEALEQMERWSDAATVWQRCVEANVNGSTAIAGRQRCQKALAPKPKATPRPVKPRPRPSAMSDLAPQKDSAAVERLRAANQAAEREDEEKFAISERVEANVGAWRDGKRDNLRALLGSLDQVLWEGSGWKKVGLHELVMANKVKIVYMKAIAKTHPDKVCFPVLSSPVNFFFGPTTPLLTQHDSCRKMRRRK